MSMNIPSSVLSEELQRIVRGRRLHAGLFTTFSFDPGFFEQEILPVLFDRSFSHVAKIRSVQLEEELRKVEHLAVYYDRVGLIAGSEPPSLDVDRIPISMPNGYFHPKLVLLLLDEVVEDVLERHLVVGILSANLTQSGWWENLECGELLEFPEHGRCSLREDLLHLLKRIRASERSGNEQRALGAIEWFIRYRLHDETFRSVKKVLHPRLYVGRESLGEFIRDRIAPGEGRFNLEIISPYLESSGSPSALIDLIEQIRPKEVRMLLPRARDGAALCTEEYYNAAREHCNVQWGELPSALTRRSNASAERSDARFIHAKIYRLWSRTEKREYVIVGSANMTIAGQSRGASGNLEAALLIDLGEHRSPRFWLDVREDEPVRFDGASLSAEEEGGNAPLPLSIRFDWSNQIVDYFWEEPDAPSSIVLISAGVPICRIDAPDAGEWRPLGEEEGNRFATLMLSSTFLEVRTDDGRSGIVLVQEIGMSRKPSIVATLTVDEILRYWALFSAEQRDTFLNERLQSLMIREGLIAPTSALGERPDSFFDHYAGIFHSFARIEAHLSSAIIAGNMKEAEYILFGGKHDSLSVLIDKLSETTGTADPDEAPTKSDDPVYRYIALLTARQMVRRIRTNGDRLKGEERKRWKAFVAERRSHFTELNKRLKSLDKLRASFRFGDAEERRSFFDWYDASFLQEIPPMEES